MTTIYTKLNTETGETYTLAIDDTEFDLEWVRAGFNILLKRPDLATRAIFGSQILTRADAARDALNHDHRIVRWNDVRGFWRKFDHPKYATLTQTNRDTIAAFGEILERSRIDDRYAIVTLTDAGRQALRQYLADTLGPGRFLLNACTTECLNALEMCMDAGEPLRWRVREDFNDFRPKPHHVNIEWGNVA